MTICKDHLSKKEKMIYSRDVIRSLLIINPKLTKLQIIRILGYIRYRIQQGDETYEELAENLYNL